MSEVGDLAADVRSLVAREPRLQRDKPEVVGEMQRLCRAAARALPALGVGVTLISEAGPQVTVAASGEPIERIEELQFSLGEGPCFEAYRTRRPVLIPDLAAVAPTRWPGYAMAAHDHGVRAVFALPLQVGAARLGVMDIYRDEADNLAMEALRRALTFAEVATATMLDGQLSTESLDDLLHGAVDNRYEVYQAQGMIMVQLGVPLADAMVRIRAYAYAHNRRLNDVAADIVTGKLVLEPDAP
jgi:GAF domain-containing protein